MDLYHNIMNGNHIRRYTRMIEVGSCFFGVVTHVVDPHSFFVLPVSYLHAVSAVQYPGKPYKKEDLKINTNVVYMSRYLFKHIRGTVYKISSDFKCEIFAMDNGFTETNVSVERIYHPSNEAALHIPMLIIECELAFCMPKHDEFSEEAIEAFECYLGNEKLLISVNGKCGEKMRVSVYNNHPEDITSMLVRNNFTSMAPAHYKRRPGIPRMVITWRDQEFDIDDTMDIRIQYGTSFRSFYACTREDFKAYLHNRADFTVYCREQPKVSKTYLEVGKAVGVVERPGGPFERATILEILEDGAKIKVRLIDWGKIIITEVGNAKAVQNIIFTATPACAFYCSAPDMVVWNNGANQNFMYIGYYYNITILQTGKGFEEPQIVNIN